MKEAQRVQVMTQREQFLVVEDALMNVIQATEMIKALTDEGLTCTRWTDQGRRQIATGVYQQVCIVLTESRRALVSLQRIAAGYPPMEK